tara:strand:+ start:3825 stop:3953 length:129 start_codon:yes stop_codon:yes gene_type:complete
MNKEGKDYNEIVIADNKQHAKSVALRNNPRSIIINVEWTFKV